MSKIIPLGEIQKSSRGFEFIDFNDKYEKSCILMQSSLAEYEPPGTSAVWLGRLPHDVTMHLDLEQVKNLVQALTTWIEHGSFGGSDEQK